MFLFHVDRKVICHPYKGVATRWNSDHQEVKATNIFMSDLQISLQLMIEDGGCDAHLLKDSNEKETDQFKLMFTPSVQMMFCRFELLSKFFQLALPHSHLVLVHIQIGLNQLRQTKFTMYEDSSH
jgi:hypothetical protein